VTPQEILQIAKDTIAIEQKSIAELIPKLNPSFAQAVKAIETSTGRVVISGIGKSAIIAQKMVATLNSTGTPALFLHAADAIHGDLGMVRSDDIVMIISKSGESPEIKVLVPLIKNFGNILIAFTGNLSSFLAKEAHYIIDCTVETEACPNNLAPTSSTTAQLVMGDALAVCLLQLKGFTPSDFAKFHPGGALGKQLYLRVKDLCGQHQAPKVQQSTAVLDDAGNLIGIITDGDVRRMLENNTEFGRLCAQDIMHTQPKTIEANALAVDALQMMRSHNISQLIVIEQEKYIGMVHLHDLIREGLV
jgi:arabinose-5-phosphate isomerase